MNRLLWVVQVLLALLFSFCRRREAIMSAAELTAKRRYPRSFFDSSESWRFWAASA